MATCKSAEVYVPGDKLAETFAVARRHLDDASRYVAAVKNIRLRAASALPLLLAQETLDLVEQRSDRPKSRWRSLGYGFCSCGRLLLPA